MIPQTERDLIIALFHRIGEQLELKDEWKKLPNAERSAMAGDFYNILIGYINQQSDKVLDDVIKIIHKKVSFPTNSGEQISCDASIRLGIIHDINTELRQNKQAGGQ